MMSVFVWIWCLAMTTFCRSATRLSFFWMIYVFVIKKCFFELNCVCLGF